MSAHCRRSRVRVHAGAGIYLGDDATVSAAPNPGYVFYTWMLDGSAVSGERDYTFTADGNHALVASFVKIPAFTISPAPEAGSALLAWPADAAGWVLQESIDLIEWWDFALAPVVIGNERIVSIGTGDERYFFRLVHP